MLFKFSFMTFVVALVSAHIVYSVEYQTNSALLGIDLHDYAVNRRNEYNLNSDYYEDEDYDDEDINDRPYCFRFTWIGSKFGSSKLKNRTCAAIVDKADLICEQPLFMNVHNNEPDPHKLWDTFKSNRSYIACRLAPGDVCVKYSYIYNKAVENITYTCTKVNIEDEGPVTSGCYSEYQNGREIEVCVCKSAIGNIPCNKGIRAISNEMVLLITSLLVAIIKLSLR